MTVTATDYVGVGRYTGGAESLVPLRRALDRLVPGGAGRRPRRPGRVALVGGEPGIGRTRLAEELGARAQEGGARVLSGRCWEAGGALAFWPWEQALRSYAGEREPRPSVRPPHGFDRLGASVN
jgi:predicted ATPase